MTLPSDHTSEEVTPSQASSGSRSSCIYWIVFVLVWLWVVMVITGRLASQILASSAITMIADAYWMGFPLIESFLLLLPLIPLAWLVKSEPWRSIYRTWLSAGLYVLLLAPVLLVFPAAFQLQALLNIILSLLAAVVLAATARRRFARSTGDGMVPDGTAGARKKSQASLLALFVAALFGIPWVLFGALGSPLDTFLATISALVLGLVATAGILYMVVGFQRTGYPPLRSLLFAGFSAGTTIFILGSAVGYPFGGMQLILTICLPPLGWLMVYLIQQNSLSAVDGGKPRSFVRRLLLPATLLAGLAAAFPLNFIDPDELALVITANTGEIMTWALAAAGLSAIVAWLSALAAAIRTRLATRWAASPPASGYPIEQSSIIPAAAVLAWLALLGIYFLLGQPGFYGEHMFVILRDQADLTEARDIHDYAQRRVYVYDILVNQAERSQAPLRQDLTRFRISHTPYYLVNALEVRGGPLVRAWIASRPEVDRVIDSPIMRPLPRTPPTASGSSAMPVQPEWNLTQIGADRVWSELGVRGANTLIGQSDSGVQFDHPELADSYRGSAGDHNYNWYDPWNHTAIPVDIGGHGTHTLGSVLGNHTGVAPDAQWIACANLARNLGNPARYLDCLQFMLAPFTLGGDPFVDGDPTRGADILNNSWGCPEIEGCDARSLQPAFNALDAAGIFVVASAGNDGPFCGSLNHPPAIYQEVYSVGANDVDRTLAIFSSRGPLSGGDWIKPDITAPGVDVLSSMPDNSYGVMSGTSMAGPHVAGTVALMWSANPDLRGDTLRTREILNRTARSYPGLNTACPGAEDTPSTANGYGLLDAFAAVQAAMITP